MNAVIVAMSVGGVIENGWNWAADNPWLALGIVVGAAVLGALGMLLIAGSAGWLAGPGILVNVLYGGLGAVLGGGGACVVVLAVGNWGGGGSTGGTGPATRGTIDAIVVSLGEGDATLRAEVTFQGDHKPRIETWNRSDISGKVENVVLDIKASRPDQLTLQVKFLNVPERLQETVVEEFRQHGVILRVEEEGTP